MKIFQKLDPADAIDFVNTSSKSELSSRFLSRLKFVFRTQGMSCFEHKECPASNTRNVLLRTQGMFCFEHKECSASNRRNVLCRTQGMSWCDHKERRASNTRNVLLQTHGMFCFEHKECFDSNTRNVLARTQGMFVFELSFHLRAIFKDQGLIRRRLPTQHGHLQLLARRKQLCLMFWHALFSNGVSEILAPNNFDSALSKAALKGPLKGPLKAVIGRLQLSSWR